MNDMSSVIVAKSDQWNADDFVAGPQTFTIREVQIRGGQEQPVNILLENSDKAFRPCKSMSRVLTQVWGLDASKYIGKSLTLYRDPTVKWGGLEVGGIRISHMSHIDDERTLVLMVTKGQRKPYKVQPLVNAPTAGKDDEAKWAAAYVAKVAAVVDADALEAYVSSKATLLSKLETKRPELHQQCVAAVEARRADFSTFAGDDFSDDPNLTDNLDRIRTDIDACKSADALAELRAEFDTLEASDEVRADMEQRFADMGRALERTGETA